MQKADGKVELLDNFEVAEMAVKMVVSKDVALVEKSDKKLVDVKVEMWDLYEVGMMGLYTAAY